MSGMNVQISVTNLTQLDRHQSDSHRTPVTHQDQNAAMAQEVAHRRVAMPVEPDAADNKNIDPEDGKKDMGRQRRSRKKGQKESGQKKVARSILYNKPDHLIDLQI